MARSKRVRQRVELHLEPSAREVGKRRQEPLVSLGSLRGRCVGRRICVCVVQKRHINYSIDVLPRGSK